MTIQVLIRQSKRKSEQERCSSLYLNNRTNNIIAREDVSANVNNTTIVYNAKNDSLITPENKDMATSANSYDKKYTERHFRTRFKGIYSHR